MNTKEFLIAIILPIFLWLITPRQLKMFISKKIFFKKKEIMIAC